MKLEDLIHCGLYFVPDVELEGDGVRIMPVCGLTCTTPDNKEPFKMFAMFSLEL